MHPKEVPNLLERRHISCFWDGCPEAAAPGGPSIGVHENSQRRLQSRIQMSSYNLRYIAILIAVTLFTFIAIKLVSKPPGVPLSGTGIESLRPIPAEAWVQGASAAEKAHANPKADASAAASKPRENHPACCCGQEG